MAKLWRIQPHDPTRILALERAASVPAVVAQLLLCRGIHDAQVAREFLEAKLTSLRDPEDLPGMTAAADRIMAAIAAGRRIVIYGDYDVDGMSGTALLFLCLKMLSAEVSYYVPNRIDEGYGLNSDSLTALAARGAQMIVTVDCGIASVAEAELARQLGLELVITDHHEIPTRLPAAAAVIHPGLPDSAYPFAGLCGAGVAFKLAWALCQRASQSKKVGPRMRDFLMQAIGLVSLGTVADVVPLVDENRVLVRHGLASLRERPGLGIAALMKLTGIDEKPELSSEDIGFMLAPRLNAAGRLGQATLGIELLTTDSADRASALAAYLHELNGSRESLERSIYLAANKQALEQFDPEGDAALVLAERGWHPGVIGIVASRLAEKFHRPVVLIAFDPLGIKPGIGSARSVPGFGLHVALQACSEHLLSHGGHAAAAGLKIEEAKLEFFRSQFCEHAAAEMSAAHRVAELRIDAEVPFSALTSSAVADIERLSPFGPANPRPLLCTSNVTLSEPPKRIGGGERHLALRLSQHGLQLRAVAFGGGEWAAALSEISGPIDVAFRPLINHFRGRKSVELQVCDWQQTAAISPTERRA
ncbi:MAG: single-stranded-DNA-specific exonuclease RecJ [Planctomycetia bacterium]|nr:single-stranded-DNA-specific exonuclease RecJ [Planctomycetia bacterium]